MPERGTAPAPGFEPAFVEERVRYGLDPVLDVNQLQERIQLLLLDPSIDRLNARLDPGQRPGESRPDLDLEEAPPYRMKLVSANNRAPSVGAEWGEATFTYVDVSGRSDLRYFISSSYAESKVIEEPFNVIDSESEILSIETGVSLSLIRSIKRDLRGDASIAQKRSTSFLAG